MPAGDNGYLEKTDPEIARAVRLELERKRKNVNLIASENYASLAVLAAQGSVLTDKYAEGYPGGRYYSGCGPADAVEDLARERAKELFGCDYANVQPHSGTQANMAAYMTVLGHGDKLMAMDLTCGGHLSHGSPKSFSGTLYRTTHYCVDRETERLDYDRVAALATEQKPKVIVAGCSSYPMALDFEAFRSIADSVGAVLVVDMAHFGGLVAGKAHPDPVPYADFVTGTTHKTLRGPRGGFVLCRGEYAGDLDSMVFPGIQGGPFIHAIAAKAVCFHEAMTPEFKEYAETIVANARALCEKMASEGFRIVAGGTETHLFMVDLRPMVMTGREAQDVLESVYINANKNEIPFDDAPAAVTSGVRFGTPAMTTRGMRREHMEVLGGLISRALKERHSESALADVRSKVTELLESFPLYPELG